MTETPSINISYCLCPNLTASCTQLPKGSVAHLAFVIPQGWISLWLN